ncbi:MAG: hypothetical protein ABRQ29_00005 [Smithellaceae bacterium]
MSLDVDGGYVTRQADEFSQRNREISHSGANVYDIISRLNIGGQDDLRGVEQPT